MSFDLESACREALTRLEALTDARIETFKRESQQRYFFIRRSISQKARRILEAMQWTSQAKTKPTNARK